MNPLRIVIKGKLASFVFGPLLCLPTVPINLFTLSVICSIGVTLLLAVIASEFKQPFLLLHTSTLDNLTGQWFFDPLVWHSIVGLMASIMIFTQAKYVKNSDMWSRSIAASLPVFLLIGVLLVGDLVIKPGYAIQRPPNPLAEPPITSFFRSLFSNRAPEPDSMPSGFVMRQMSLFYLVIWMVVTKRGSSKWINLMVHFINVAGLLIITFSRVYRNAHTLLDVATAIGIGTLLFWIIMLPPFSLISVRGFSVNKIRLSTLIGGNIILFLIFLGFSNNAAALIKLFTCMLILIGGAYIVSPLIYLADVRVFPRHLHMGT